MTIAAGFVYQKGILLCADTLMGGQAMSLHESKIMGYSFSDGLVLFAFAGAVDLAEAAIQQCEAPLENHVGKPRSHSQIANVIRSVLAREYKANVLDSALMHTHDYSVIAAIYSKVDGVSLHCSYLTQMKQTRRGFELYAPDAK
jgi:hypothetical protein